MNKLFFSILIAGAISTSCGDKNSNEREMEKQSARQGAIDSVNMANAEQRRMDSLAAVPTLSEPDAVILPEPKLPEDKKATRKKSPSTAGVPAPTPTHPSGNNDNQTGTASTETVSGEQTETAGTSTLSAEEKKKKGLNNAAKGAIIGLGTGAAAGAVINKNNRGKGAVVGGVIGAIGGAVGGAVIDKQKEKKAKKDTTGTEDKK